MEQDLSRALNIGDFGGFVLTAKLALSSFFTTPISVIAKHGMAERLWLDPTVFFTGWWFGTFYFFHSVGNVIIPSDEVHHFSEGWLNHQPDYY